MYSNILFKRWDNQVFRIEFEQTGLFCTIVSVTHVPDCTYTDAKNAFSCDDLKFHLDTDPYGKTLDYIELTDRNGSGKYWFPRKEFLFHVELECDPNSTPADAIIISNIKDYMNVIQYYRYIALTVRIQALTQTGRFKNTDLAKAISQYVQENVRLKKVPYAIITSFNKESLDHAVHIIKTGILDAYEKYTRTKCLTYEDQQIYKAITHTIDLYFTGENFLHYRGVGHIIYPELPSALRGKNKSFEDQYYRLAKTTHPNELANLSYLDRIAKIQHYGWPSRLIDVTSNPLVALYMACNTIYTTDDPQQIDFGEIIIYFRNELPEKTYDSKSVLIAAALVKLTYQERKAMFEFINMHDKYFHFEKANIGLSEETLRAALNFCLRIAVERGSDTVLTPEEITQLSMCISSPQIDFSSCAHPEDYIYRCIQGLTGSQKIKWHKAGEDQRLRYHCGPYTPSDEQQRYQYVYTVDINFNTYKELFRYFVSAYDRLLVTIRRENTAFQNKIDVFTVLRSYHVRLGMSNDRILAQAGSFIISGLDDVYTNEKLESSRRQGYARIIVAGKRAIFDELKLLNINDSTMLPDLQHTGDYIKKQFTKYSSY